MEKDEENLNEEDCSCCDCGPSDSNVEEVVSGNAFVLNTLIDLLIEKNVISEKELLEKLESSQKEIEESMDKLEETEEEISEILDEELDK